MKIAILYNTPSDRFLNSDINKEAEDDTKASAIEVAEVLQAPIVAINEHTIEKTIASIDADLVFNLIEWTGVDTPYAKKTFEELENKKIPYTGANWYSYYLSCDKILLKKTLDEHGFPNARWQAFQTGYEFIRKDFQYPVIVKVSLEHSSVGLTKDAVFQSPEGLSTFLQKRIAKFKQPVFIEEFLAGREFQVTILQTANGLITLPPAEIVYTKNTDIPLLTYDSRWDETSPEYSNSKVVVALTDSLVEQLAPLCIQAFNALGFRDYARFDIRCQENMPMFLELNSNPGLGDDDEYAMTISYKAAGMTFADMVREIVQSAARRYGM